MSNVPSSYDVEIDFLTLIQTIWDEKWKITFIIAVSLLLVFGFNIVKPNTNFIASTEIKPITSFEFNKYSLFNASLKNIKQNAEDVKDVKDVKDEKILNIFEITQKSLLNLYIEQIEEGSLLETGIDKFNLIDKDDFDNESDYKDAIEKFASEIEVLIPTEEKNEKRLYHTLRAKYNNKDKWKELLIFVNNEANRKVKASIINRFATIVSIQNQIKDFTIKDLDIKIDNVKHDYDKNTKNKLAFLAEQASIARKLNIEKDTISSQRFNTQNTVLTNVKTDAPFYLRGYLAIEEEIKQITTRNDNDKNAFTSGLLELERQKRAIEQDETMKRAVTLFNGTPLNQNEFQATIVKVATTDYEENNKLYLYYALAIVLGGIIGVVYVLIVNAFRNRKSKTVSS